MDRYPQEKESLLHEDMPIRDHPTWFGYRRRTIFIFIAMILAFFIFEVTLIPLQLHKCPSNHSNRGIQNVNDDPLSLSTTVNRGQMTFYEPGLGSCGLQNTRSDLICAISKGLYGTLYPSPFSAREGSLCIGLTLDSKGTPNPNNNPFCKKKIKACRGGKCVVVEVVDRCEGCKYWDLDMSPAAFRKLADPNLGRVDITWNFV